MERQRARARGGYARPAGGRFGGRQRRRVLYAMTLTHKRETRFSAWLKCLRLPTCRPAFRPHSLQPKRLASARKYPEPPIAAFAFKVQRPSSKYFHIHQGLVRTVKALSAGRPLRSWYSSRAVTGHLGRSRSGRAWPAPARWRLRCSPVDRWSPCSRTWLLCS